MLEIYKRNGIKPPQPPEYDYTAQKVLDTFYLLLRERRYVDNQPLRLSVSDITNVITAHPINVQRSILDPIIFDLDDIYLNDSKSNNGENIAQ